MDLQYPSARRHRPQRAAIAYDFGLMTTARLPAREAAAEWPAPLYDLTRAVVAARHPDDVCEAALTCLSRSLGVTRASVLLFDREGVMRFNAWRGLSDGYRAAVDGHSPWTRDTTDAQPVLVPDVRTDPSLAGLRDTIEGEGIRALAFVPLQLSTTLLGKFMLYYEDPHDFTEHEVLTAQTVAAHVAFALDQQEHRESGDRARTVLESLGVAFYTTDANGMISFYNAEAAALWGRRPELGVERWSGAARLFWPDGREMKHSECPTARALEQRMPIRGCEVVAERPDGTRVHFVPHPTPIFDSAGVLLGAVNVLIDITSRKRTEEALEEREASLEKALTERERLLSEREHTIALGELTQVQLASLIEASGELIATSPHMDAVRKIFTIEADLLGADAHAVWRFLGVNDEWEVALSQGLSDTYLRSTRGPQRVLAEPWILEDVRSDPRVADLRHRYDAEGIVSMFVCPLTNGQEVNGTVAFYYRSLHRFTDLEVRVGVALANLASASLNTARLFEQNEQARGRLRQTNAELEGIAAELREANAAKDEFLSLVSHELKTPLTTIRGNAGVLFTHKDSLEAGARDDALRDIVAESERLHRIIENLLLLARAEQRSGLEAEPVLVVRVVERVVKSQRQRRPDREIEIIQEGKPKPVIFSEASLEQVIENLISNAAKYSPSGAPITIAFSRTSREVRLRVLDRGVGIDDIDLDRVFDRFYRSASARGRAEGLGIGLAVCKRLIEAQGGRLWAKPRDGGGAEFGFALPITEDDGTDGADPTP